MASKLLILLGLFVTWTLVTDLTSAATMTCYDCAQAGGHETGGTCGATVDGATSTDTCDGECQTKIQDKTPLGMGIFYERKCTKNCQNETGTHGRVTFTEICCTGSNLCNGPLGLTTTTTTTTTPDPTGTEPTGETGTTDSTPTVAPTTTTVVGSQKCYSCTSWFLDFGCDNEGVDTSWETVNCEPGQCAKSITSGVFDWMGTPDAVTRGCSTQCVGDPEVDMGDTIIYCCTGDHCNLATRSTLSAYSALLIGIVSMLIAL